MEPNDEFYMKEALRLARRGLGKTSPNPMVGAVIVRDGNIIGKGHHRRYGGPHAEVEAIRDAQGDINGATMYVTLEPCCHYKKKTPPCLDLLLQYDLKKVVIGTLDPNPVVDGKSVEALRQRGIETISGVLGEECEKLNEVFFKWIRKGMPFVTLKLAQTIDGRIATDTGDARWISSEKSRKLAHKLRGTHDVVLIGVGTVMADNPQLTVRNVKGRNPQRIIVDSNLKIPLDSQILTEQDIAPTIVATTSQSDSEKKSSLKEKGVEILIVEKDGEGRVDLTDLLKELGERNISSILIEGGSAIATSFIQQNLVDRYVFVVAPKIIGKGIESIGDLGLSKVDDAVKLTFTRTYKSGSDCIIEARPGIIED